MKQERLAPLLTGHGAVLPFFTIKDVVFARQRCRCLTSLRSHNEV